MGAACRHPWKAGSCKGCPFRKTAQPAAQAAPVKPVKAAKAPEVLLPAAQHASPVDAAADAAFRAVMATFMGGIPDGTPQVPWDAVPEAEKLVWRHLAVQVVAAHAAETRARKPADPKPERAARPEQQGLGMDPVSGGTVFVRDGKFGPFVSDGETSASIPAGEDPAGVTLFRASELLAAKRAKRSRRAA